jgi:DNA-binding MarR family transcriptional regulator/GNAT superfamily N-acetyltransferase
MTKTHAARIATVRQFNRFYTRQMGLLPAGLLRTNFPLTEVRVLYELAHRKHPSASEIATELGLDPGYLSRILRMFEKRHWIKREAVATDGRQRFIGLAPRGRRVFAQLDRRSNREVWGMLSQLSSGQQKQLAASMQAIERLLGAKIETEPVSYVLRPPQPGDLGWVVHRHGALYAREYSYDERFEALVAEIVGEFVANFDPRRERCWIAEKDGEVVGSVFLVKKSKTTAKLRLLLVEPSARGLGIGKRLVDECVRFARQAGYKRIMLWTQSELRAARGIYQSAGFRLVARQRHRSWARANLVAETWSLKLY